MADYFIAGTDTSVGKTHIAAAILLQAKQRGLSSLAIKPIAAGCEASDEGLRNEDALILQRFMSVKIPYAQVNPIALEIPCSPHIAAAKAGTQINLSRLTGFCRGAFMQKADIKLVEGAGGWRVPINQHHTMADLAKSLDSKIILVVGMRLGCINHALLTIEAIARDGLKIAGWVANTLEPNMLVFEENVATLKSSITAPCLGVVPFLAESASEDERIRDMASYIDIDPLIRV